jgi:SAM-dependent methyltransferase
MTERYDEMAAAHYSAYRPPLHRIIMKRVLADDEWFAAGLDVGCGTGYSAIALAGHCDRVCGLDPSPSMLARAAPHDRVSYVLGTGERIPLVSGSVGVVTLAGSLFYADTNATGEEITRVCPQGLVVVYDFEVLLEDVLRRLEFSVSAGGSAYDHRANFSGVPGFTGLMAGSDRVSMHVTAAELAHVLLSDSHRFDFFAGRYRASDPFQSIVSELPTVFDRGAIEADIYYSKYRLGDEIGGRLRRINPDCRTTP